MAEARHKYDANQCLKMAYDPESNSFRMMPSDETSFAIELDHKDGDSVYSVPMHKYMKGQGELNVSDCRVVTVYGSSIKLSPHPTDDVWFDLAPGTHEIAACRLKCEDDNTYVVARS